MPWWGYVLSMGGWFYGLYSLFGLRSSQTIIRCKTTAEGKWHLYQNNGERLIGLLDGQTYMCHFFLILVFKISAPRKASRHIMIFRDSIDAAEWRHLMRYLFVWRIKIGKK